MTSAKPAAQMAMAHKAAAMKKSAAKSNTPPQQHSKKLTANTAAARVRLQHLPPRFNPPADSDDDNVRLMMKREVLDRVGVTYPTLWNWMRAGRFPRSRELGGKTCWIESEVLAWIAALPKSRLKGDANTEVV